MVYFISAVLMKTEWGVAVRFAEKFLNMLGSKNKLPSPGD
jgi:hypothetical protein